MQFKKTHLFLITISCFISVNAHQTDCFERDGSDLSRPCIERLKPRALNAVDRSMKEPSLIRISDTLMKRFTTTVDCSIRGHGKNREACAYRIIKSRSENQSFIKKY